MFRKERLPTWIGSINDINKQFPIIVLNSSKQPFIYGQLGPPIDFVVTEMSENFLETVPQGFHNGINSLNKLKPEIVGDLVKKYLEYIYIFRVKEPHNFYKEEDLDVM